MRYTIFLTGLLALLILPGCVHEKDFEVTGIVPPSQMREDAAPRRRTEPAVVKAPRRDAMPEMAPQAERTVERQPGKARKQPAATATTAAPVTFPDAEATAAKPTKVRLIPDMGLVGKVASVNASLHFVVLNFPVGRMAALDQQMVLYRQGQKIGEVKITGPQQDDNIIADVISGDVEAGDEVREN